MVWLSFFPKESKVPNLLVEQMHNLILVNVFLNVFSVEYEWWMQLVLHTDIYDYISPYQFHSIKSTINERSINQWSFDLDIYSRVNTGNKTIAQLNNRINQKFGFNKTILPTPTLRINNPNYFHHICRIKCQMKEKINNQC